jgi:hypothetical protein
MIDERGCTYPGCDLTGIVACMHEARCEVHMRGSVCDIEECNTEIALAFIGFMRDVCERAVKLREQIAPSWLLPLEFFMPLYNHFYPAYREMYDDEGAPLGPGDEDMWRWHEARFIAPVH